MHPRPLTFIVSMVFFSLSSVMGSGSKQSEIELEPKRFTDPVIELSIYPNPSYGKISVEIGRLEKPILLNLFDIIGNKVYGLEIRSEHRHQINLCHLEKGFYMARFTNGSELVETRRIQIR